MCISTKLLKNIDESQRKSRHYKAFDRTPVLVLCLNFIPKTLQIIFLIPTNSILGKLLYQRRESRGRLQSANR